MTKEQLRRYGDLKLERDQLYRFLQEVESQMVTPKASKFTGLPVHHDISDDRFASCIYRRDVLRTRYAAKITELTCELDAIESAIQVLPSRERTLIRLHYIEGKTWEQVAVTMSYSWRQVHRIHSKALQMLSGQPGEGMITI